MRNKRFVLPHPESSMQQNTQSLSLAAQIEAMTGPVPLSLDLLSQVVGGGGPVGNWQIKTASTSPILAASKTTSGPVGNW
jgi:hypothetical protein